jgi:diguanylate cyclase (GGDEF)-like protein
LLREPLQKIFGKDTMEVHVAIRSGKPQKMMTESGRFLHVQVTPIATNNAVAGNANVLMFRDVSDVEKAQNDVNNSEKLLRTLINQSVNGIIRMRWVDAEDLGEDRRLCCIFANAAAGRYLGIDSENMIGKTVEELLCFATSGMDEDEQALVQQQFSDSTNRGEMIDTEMRVVNDGVSQWLRMIGEPVGDDVAITFVDVNDSKAKEKRMGFIAISDPLTGVLNRRGFERNAARRLRDSDDDATGALLFIDLNAFKQINDRYGHEVGDQLLITAAERLRKGLRSCDIIGRPGGDEFVALVPDVRALVAEKLAIRLTRSLEQEYRIGNRKLNCPSSIGFALYPDHANTLTGLLRAADAAMYRAKARSRNVTDIGDSVLLEKAV